MTTSNSALALNSINIVRTSAILFTNIINICTRIIDNIFSLKAKSIVKILGRVFK